MRTISWLILFSFMLFFSFSSHCLLLHKKGLKLLVACQKQQLRESCFNHDSSFQSLPVALDFHSLLYAFLLWKSTLIIIKLLLLRYQTYQKVAFKVSLLPVVFFCAARVFRDWQQIKNGFVGCLWCMKYRLELITEKGIYSRREFEKN